MNTIFTLKELADCALREVGMRQKVYPRLIRQGGITKRLAAREIAKMMAIATHFGELEEKDRLL